MKPPLFLIPGWNMSPEIWRPVIQQLGRERMVVTARLPGYGGSTPADVGLPADAPLDSLLMAYLDALHDQAPPDAAWCGWSLGATLALAAAARSPSRRGDIGELVLIAPTPRFLAGPDWPWGMREQNFDRLTRLTLRNHRVGFNRFWQLQSPDPEAGSDEPATTGMPPIIAPPPRALTDGQRLLCGLDLREMADRIECPTTIIAAHHDRIVRPEASRWLADRIAHSRWEPIGQCHAIPWFEPVAVATRLLATGSRASEAQR